MRATTYLKRPSRVRTEADLPREQKRRRPEEHVRRMQRRVLTGLGLAAGASGAVWAFLRRR